MLVALRTTALDPELAGLFATYGGHERVGSALEQLADIEADQAREDLQARLWAAVNGAGVGPVLTALDRLAARGHD